MKKSFPILGLLFLAFLFACEDEDKKDNDPVNVGFTEYPLKVGNSWQFERFWVVTDHNSVINDSLEYFYNVINSEITREVLLKDTIAAFELKETGVEDVYQSFLYLNNTNDGLLSYGNIGGSNVAPYKHQFKYSYYGKQFNSLNTLLRYFTQNETSKEDSILYEVPPALSLKYPLKEGEEWLMKNIGWGESGAYIYKTILGKQKLIVPAGTFDCYKIQRKWCYEDGTIWLENNLLYDYIAKEGIIARQFFLKNIVVQNVQGDTLGHIDVEETIQLLSYEHK